MAQGDREWGYSESITVPLCHSFFLMLFPCSSMDPLHGLQLLSEEPAPTWAGHGLQIIQSISIFPCIVSSTWSRFTPSLILVFAGLFLPLPFPKYVFPEAPLALLVGTAVSCGGSGAEPLTFFHKGHTCRALTAITWPSTTNAIWQGTDRGGKKKQQKNHLPTHTTQNHTEDYKGKKFH